MAITQQGSVLVLCLWLLAFLAGLVVMLGGQILSERRLIQAFRVRIEERLAIETMRARFEAAMSLDDSKKYDALNEAWSNSPQLFQDVPLGKEARPSVSLYDGVRYGVIDEDRFININLANLQLLKQHFIYAAGLDETAADLLASAVQDWRDLDVVSTSAATDTETVYGSYPCKNDLYQSLEELMLVHGMDETIYKAIRDSTTIFGGGKVNFNTAPAAVLRSLGAPDSLSEKIMRFRTGDDRSEGTKDDGHFETVGEIEPKLQGYSGNLTTEEMNALTTMTSQDWIGVSSEAFRLPVELTAHGKTWRRDVVIDRNGKLLEVR